MKVAVFFNQTIQLGGGFNHTHSVAKLLKQHQSKDYEFFFFTTDKAVYEAFKKYAFHLHYIKISLFDKIIAALVNYGFSIHWFNNYGLSSKHKLVKYLDRTNIDLVFFTSPSPLALILKKHNFLLTVFDSCHRDYLEFPEVSADNNFENREKLYKQCTPRAIRVLTDSEAGRQNLIRRYGLDDDRVLTFPFLPSSSTLISEADYHKNFIDIKNKYKIPGDYVYYPAQFWPHKNHIYIIDGLKILLDDYKVKINAVFSGSDRGNLGYVQNYAKLVGIEDQVYYTGFVPSQEIPYLYKQSVALVMPTYFGPTNIPPLEAFALKVPILYSDLPGLRDQVPEAALLMDLTDPNSMAGQLMQLYHNQELREQITSKGSELLSALMKNDQWLTLKKIFDDYQFILKRWKRC